MTLYVRLKIAIFKKCLESLNMGRVCSASMPVVTLQSFKVIGRLDSGSRLIGAWSSAFAFNVFVCQVEPLDIQIH